MRRKVLSVVLCVCMMMTMAPFAFAEEANSADTPSEVAQIGDTKYTTLDAAIGAAEDGDTVTLLQSITTDATKTATKDRLTVHHSITLDLNGKTITIPYSLEPTDNWSAFYIASGTMTVKDSIGTGAIKSGDETHLGTYLFHLQGGNLIIESGTFFGGCTIANVQNGTATVNGGTFAVYPDSDTNDSRYLLNCIDASYKTGTAKIIVTGGTFENFDPANCTAEGAGTNFCAEGYGTKQEGNNYIVTGPVAVINETETKYPTLAAAITAASDGQTIKLIADTEVASAITIQKNITLDLNGQKITSTVTPVPGYLVPAFKIIAGGSLNVTGKGTIDGNNELGLFNLVGTAQAASTQSSKLVIDKDVTVCNSVYAFAVNQSGSNHSCNVFVDLYGKVVGEEPVYVNGTITPDSTNAPEIRIHDSAVFSMQKDELYLAGYAKTTIEDGATLTNSGGNVITIAAGELTVNGGTFTGGNVMKDDVQGTGGAISVSTSSAIFVKQHSTNQDLKVTINGGTFKAAVPFYQATGYASTPDPKKVTLSITGGSFASTRISDGGVAVKSDDKTAATNSGFITGGYFNTDPSAYCGKNANDEQLTGVANTTDTKADYPWTVGVKGEKAAPVVSSSLPASVPANASDDLKNVAKDLSDGATMTSDAIEAAVADTANENKIVATKEHANKLKDVLNETDNIDTNNVKIVYQTYVDMQLTDIKTTPTLDGKAQGLYELTVNLTPKYRVIATTEDVYESWEAGNIKLLVDGDEALQDDSNANSILVQNPQTLDLQDGEYQIVIPLPQMFSAAKGQKLSVKHEKQDGTVEYYTGTVKYGDRGDKYLTFTTNGFSPFTISAAAAFIGNTAYPTLQEAVDAAQNNDVITLVKSGDVSATMSGTSRTITVKAPAGATTPVKVTVNGETKDADATDGATFTYTRPSHSGSSSGSTTTSYNVNVTAATNGTVAADKKTAAKGATVTVTATPAKGYVVDAVKVVDKDGKDVAVTAKDGKYVFTMPGSAVTVTGTFKAETPAESGLPFTDVKSGDWFYDAVKYAYENGLMTGTSATTFAPNGTMNRAMIVTVLYRLEKSPAVTAAAKFTDVPAGQWYSDAVAWAAANNIVNGYSETSFGPMNPVTREQMAAILFRYEQYKGLENVTLEENLNRFPDQDKISSYAVPAMQWAVGQKIINGNADGTLDPTGTATRAQVAQIFMNLLK